MITDCYEKCKDILFQIVNCLSGSDKRIQAAALSNAFGRGGQSIISKELNMSRDTIRKGQRELAGNFQIIDKHHAKGRKKAGYKFPLLLEDIRSIVDSQSQTDPNFKTTRLFTRLTIREFRKQLVLQKSYTDEEKPNSVIISIDAKDKVKIGEFSRGGKSRTVVKAIDHDFSAR